MNKAQNALEVFLKFTRDRQNYCCIGDSDGIIELNFDRLLETERPIYADTVNEDDNYQEMFVFRIYNKERIKGDETEKRIYFSYEDAFSLREYLNYILSESEK